MQLIDIVEGVVFRESSMGCSECGADVRSVELKVSHGQL